MSEIKDDDEALETLKTIGFMNIEIKELTLDIVRQIEDAFGQEQSRSINIKRLKTYV